MAKEWLAITQAITGRFFFFLRAIKATTYTRAPDTLAMALIALT